MMTETKPLEQGLVRLLEEAKDAARILVEKLDAAHDAAGYVSDSTAFTRVGVALDEANKLSRHVGMLKDDAKRKA